MFKWLFGGKDKDSSGGAEAGGNAEMVIVSTRVKATPDQAFATFVEGFNDWWPRAMTYGGDKVATVSIEPKMNGRAIEKNKDGSEVQWGTVLSFFRPNHIVVAWQITPNRQLADSEAMASRVDVRFVETEPGTTEVVVVHRDFPRHGDGWEKYRKDMAAKSGWPSLIDAYTKAAGAA
jgi:hypothetical protein